MRPSARWRRLASATFRAASATCIGCRTTAAISVRSFTPCSTEKTSGSGSWERSQRRRCAMSSAAFERIASRYEAHRSGIAALENYLSVRSTGIAIRPEAVADFIDLRPEFIQSLFDQLVKDDVMQRRACWICPECDAPIERKSDDENKRECDLCCRPYSSGEVEFAKCYFLKRTILRTMPRRSKSGEKVQINPMTDPSSLKYAHITPWQTLREDDYTIPITTLGDGPRKAALSLLEKYGIARLRWEGDTPTPDKLLSFENWVGPVRAQQNDFKGKVQSLHPDHALAANTGSSAKPLAPHVDGTQDDFTPAILAFQYDLSSTWGAESTFIDMAALMGSLPPEQLERICTALARADCATCTKTKGEWTKTYCGSIVRAECAGRSISVRLRLDDLLKVIPECRREFESLRAAVSSWAKTNVLRYTPHDGDVVIFDNLSL